MIVSGRTRIVGIIGDPVAHSSSPAMHNAAFRHLSLDFIYVAFRVPPAQLRAAVAGIRALGLIGINVTVPHKEHIVGLLDSVSPTAQRVGAANTILNQKGRLHGDNTDVTGVRQALRNGGCRVHDARVLLVGAGGAARAVLAALAGGGAAQVTIANRTVRRARQLADEFVSPKMRTDAASLSALRNATLLGSVDLVVNATSVGLHGERFFPLAYAASRRSCVFFDLIYGRRTDFLRGATAAARHTLDGSDMLLHQGAAAFALWTRRRAPLAIMRGALAKPQQIKIDKG